MISFQAFYDAIRSSAKFSYEVLQAISLQSAMVYYYKGQQFSLLQGMTNYITKCDRFSKVRRSVKIVTKLSSKHLPTLFIKLNNISYGHHPRKSIVFAGS